jgi:hypothetical protein
MSVLLLCYSIVTIYSEFFYLSNEDAPSGNMLKFNGLYVANANCGAEVKKQGAAR